MLLTAYLFTFRKSCAMGAFGFWLVECR